VTLDPQLPARLAAAIGKPVGLTCRYEYDGRKQKFMYRFYRCGHYVGAVSDPKRVVAKMERYATAK
jgi:hypothetical protein